MPSPDSSGNPFYCFNQKHLVCVRCGKTIKRLQRIAGNSFIPKQAQDETIGYLFFNVIFTNINQNV